jgi:hypothetical protein
MENENEDGDGINPISVPVVEAPRYLVAPGSWNLGLAWAKWLVPQLDGIALIGPSRGRAPFLEGSYTVRSEAATSKQAAQATRAGLPCESARLVMQGCIFAGAGRRKSTYIRVQDSP